MSVSLDASINALVHQSQAMSQVAVQAQAQIELVKDVHAMQESAVMTLISSVGLTTYDQSGATQSVPAVGQRVNTVG